MQNTQRNITLKWYKINEKLLLIKGCSWSVKCICHCSLLLYHLEVIFLPDLLQAYGRGIDKDTLRNSLTFDKKPLRYRGILTVFYILILYPK